MTATGSERCTATPWRGSGRGFGTSSGRSGVSTKRTENSTSSFSRGLTTSRRSPTSSCGYCSDARKPPNWLHEPKELYRVRVRFQEIFDTAPDPPIPRFYSVVSRFLGADIANACGSKSSVASVQENRLSRKALAVAAVRQHAPKIVETTD